MREVIGVVEADGLGDFENFHVGAFEQDLRFLHAQVLDIAGDAFAGFFLEQVAEVA